MAKDDGGPAFPRYGVKAGFSHTKPYYEDGMTLRDWFAGQALCFITHPDMKRNALATDIAHSAYMIADAMLAERSKR